jgi:hypothetical protein
MDAYAIPETTYKQLEAMVARIEADPGRSLTPDEFEVELDTSTVLASLPPGLSEDDFAGILKLAMLTECATDIYVHEISSRAREFKATWLERFNENVWKPDEYLHAEPFKRILLALGFSEAELDREIEETQAREFEHVGGDSPIHVTTFGMVQEYLTDHYHGLISKLLRPAMPEAAAMTARIKQRETLHMLWYRDMTAIQVEANPDFIHEVADELNRFRLPGNSLIPDLQSQATRWLPLMGADFNQIVKDMVRLLHNCAGSSERLGRLSFDLGSFRDSRLGPLKAQHLDWALNRFGGWGYGLVGEAILERVGCSYLFKSQHKENTQDGIAERTRGLLRTRLARQLPVSVTAAG